MPDRTYVEIARGRLASDPTRTVTLERIERPGALTVWRVRFRRADGTHRGTSA